MSGSANLKLVVSANNDDESDFNDAGSAATSKIAIIATKEKEAFQLRFAAQLGKSIFVVDNGKEAIQLVDKLRDKLDLFFADFRQLDDLWTGQRFLKHIRAMPHLAAVKVYLTAERWEPHQEQWIVKSGAMGYVRRSADELAKHILVEVPKPAAPPPTPRRNFAALEEAFGRFAGPMRNVHIHEARQSLELGYIEPTDQGYIDELTSKLSLPERRDAFQKLAQDIVGGKVMRPSDTTLAGDPWRDAVNRHFKSYAGALGAKLLISQALNAVERSGNSDRLFYVSTLAHRLNDPSRRAEFLTDLKKSGLMG